MTWDYRILAYKDGGETHYGIHEVYYNKEGKPESYSQRGATITSYDLEDIKWNLKQIKKCLTKPVLSIEHFPEIFK